MKKRLVALTLLVLLSPVPHAAHAIDNGEYLLPSVTEKTGAGFEVLFSAPASNGGRIDWQMIR